VAKPVQWGQDSWVSLTPRLTFRQLCLSVHLPSNFNLHYRGAANLQSHLEVRKEHGMSSVSLHSTNRVCSIAYREILPPETVKHKMLLIPP